MSRPQAACLMGGTWHDTYVACSEVCEAHGEVVAEDTHVRVVLDAWSCRAGCAVVSAVGRKQVNARGGRSCIPPLRHTRRRDEATN
jgi:hypothetical protein